ncbi:hypothetical protein FRC04_011621 [Tulasnella sp. 424]|nr:hypothetical protein FRC04_011621 [Tulasnella sp. 424]
MDSDRTNDRRVLVSVPHVVARKVSSNHKPPQLFHVIKTNLDDAMETDEIQEIANLAEVTECITAIQAALRSRMDFY